MGHSKVINGVHHPSVTEMTGMMPKPYLIHWGVREERSGFLGALVSGDEAEIERYLAKERCTDARCFCEFQKKQKAGADAGTGFHALVEAYLKGDNNLQTHADTGEWRAYERFLRWVKKHTVKPIHLELRNSHPIWKYVGTFDGLCEIDGVLRLADWKSSSKMDPSYKLQVAAYGGLAVAHGLVESMPAGLILRCDKREKPYGLAVDEEWLTPQEMEENFEIFASLRRPFHFAWKHGMFKIGD